MSAAIYDIAGLLALVLVTYGISGFVFYGAAAVAGLLRRFK